MLISIIIPVFNEALRIAGALERLCAIFSVPGRHCEIIVVDDGSTDGTFSVVERQARALSLPVTTIRYEKNYGKGYAVRKGVMAASGDAVFFTDADLSASLDKLDEFLSALANGYDIAIASRVVSGAVLAVPQAWWRQGMGRVFNFIARGLFGLKISDTQCGLKFFKREAARAIFAECVLNRFAFDVEIILLARSKGMKIIEIPVTWTNSAASRVHPVGDSLAMLLDLARLKLRLNRRIKNHVKAGA